MDMYNYRCDECGCYLDPAEGRICDECADRARKKAAARNRLNHLTLFGCKGEKNEEHTARAYGEV